MIIVEVFHNTVIVKVFQSHNLQRKQSDPCGSVSNNHSESILQKFEKQSLSKCFTVTTLKGSSSDHCGSVSKQSLSKFFKNDLKK